MIPGKGQRPAIHKQLNQVKFLITRDLVTLDDLGRQVKAEDSLAACFHGDRLCGGPVVSVGNLRTLRSLYAEDAQVQSDLDPVNEVAVVRRGTRAPLDLDFGHIPTARVCAHGIEFNVRHFDRHGRSRRRSLSEDGCNDRGGHQTHTQKGTCKGFHAWGMEAKH